MQLTQPAPPTRARPSWSDWAKENLFSTPLNSVLTVVSSLLILWVLYGFLSWALTAARWNVVPTNWRILMVGSYPAEQLWRVWTVLSVVSLTAGLHWGGASRGSRVPAWPFVTAGLIAAFFLVTQSGFPSSLLVPVAVLALFAGFFAGRMFVSTRAINLVWLGIFVAAMVLLSVDFGAGGVQTSLWGGLLLTIILAVVGIVASFPLGVLLAIGRTSQYPIISAICTAFIEIVRGTPLVVVFFIAQLFVPLLLGGTNIDPLLRAMVGITVFSAAYLAENVRGGLQSLSAGQTEAARALGLNGTQTLSLIVLPQALRAVVPALVGQGIALFKDTSLVYIIGLKELTNIANSVTKNPEFIGTEREMYFVISVIYFIFSYAMSLGARNLEKRLNTSR
jgi:general L-amino acid transport system permease protein